jgi:hypothetical protein
VGARFCVANSGAFLADFLWKRGYYQSEAIQATRKTDRIPAGARPWGRRLGAAAGLRLADNGQMECDENRS